MKEIDLKNLGNLADVGQANKSARAHNPGVLLQIPVNYPPFILVAG